MIGLLQLVFVLIVAGVICWLVAQASFIAPFFKSCIYALIGLFALWYVITHLPLLALH